MKFIICICMCLFLMLGLAGCSGGNSVDKSDSSVSASSEQPLMPELEYTDISELLLKGKAFGKGITECGLPPENLFVEDEKMQGYDYVSLFGLEGTLSVYLSDGNVTSFVFGSNPFESKEEFRQAFDNMNKQIAEKTGMETVLPVLFGAQGDGDEVDKVFSGTGVLSAEYKLSEISLSVKSCGVNETATIVVECAPVK